MYLPPSLNESGVAFMIPIILGVEKSGIEIIEVV